MIWALLVVAVLIIIVLVVAFIAFKMTIVRRAKKPETEEIYINRERNREKNNAYFLSHEPEDVSIITPDGLTLRGWYAPAENPTKRFVIFSHGYRCNGPDEFSHIYPFYHHKLGYNCLFPDHRAHGRSEGKYIGFGALDYKDILLWVGYLIGRFGDDIEIILHGISMGAATVMLVNQAEPPEQVKLVIEDCGYTNAHEQISETLKSMIGFKFDLLVRLCSFVCKMRAGYELSDADCLSNMSKSKNPILFIHGDNDAFVPTQMGLSLYESCDSVPCDLLLVEGAIHAFSYYDAQEDYEAKVKEFIDKHIGERANV
ncbi:MAG TPA: alpha/beta hydrolase [Clostridia bacterium]|nr:alpha/beta hydrolase [Clostridia bacterium]